MKRPRPGSRKSLVFDAYMESGERRALAVGQILRLKEATIRSWITRWRKLQKGEVSLCESPISPPSSSPPSPPTPMTKIEDRERVYDISFPKTHGSVIHAGGNVSEVRWDIKTPWGKQTYTQNKYLRSISITPSVKEETSWATKMPKATPK